MTVFKAYLKILKRYLGMVIFYTALLIVFATVSVQTSDAPSNYVQEKPNIVIINNDENKGITKDFIKYLEDNTNVRDLKETDEINDAIFYREISYAIYIPKDFRKTFLYGEDVKLDIKSSGDYGSSLTELLIENYMNTAYKYRSIYNDEEIIINKLDDTLKLDVEVKVARKVDINKLTKMAYYFNYANYSLLAGCVYVICLIVASFNNEKIKRRNIISKTDYKKFNKDLLCSNFVFAFTLYLIYVLFAFVINGNILFTLNGLMHIINMFVFTICALSIAFLISNIVSNKNAINGIIQVVALGSSFLCGAFVPAELLPDFVLKIAHVLPSYYYIESNEIIKTLDTINITTLKPVLINMFIVCIFTIIFILLTLIISKNKRID